MWIGDIAGWAAGTVFWIFVAAVILVPQYLRHLDRARLHETLRIAFEKGQPVPPELIDSLQRRVGDAPIGTPERDLRRAVVLIAVGLGLVGLGYGLWYGLMIVSEVPAYIVGGVVAGTGAVPGFIGVAYLILWLTKRSTTHA